MRSLQTGLRCLILLSMQSFTTVELHSIVTYHGHSLRCISIPNRTLTGERQAVVHLLNNLPQLNTVVTSLRALGALPTPVVNTSIKHVYVEMDRDGIEFLTASLLGNFPALTTLSINFCYTIFVCDLVEMLASHPTIHTINVSCKDNISSSIAKWQKQTPSIKVGNCEGFDKFSIDYL